MDSETVRQLRAENERLKLLLSAAGEGISGYGARCSDLHDKLNAAADAIERLTRELDEALALLHGTKGEVSTTGVLEEAIEFKKGWVAASAERDALRAEVERLTRELDEARDMTWFWQIVDRDGLNNVSSDERVALAELVRYAAECDALRADVERLKREIELHAGD